MLEQFLQAYQIGSLVNFEGIAAGVVNTNYSVTTTRGEFVLTLFEVLGVAELPYYLSLMAFLAERGIPSPLPIGNKKRSHLAILAGKPAALVEKRPGASVMAPTVAHCRDLGTCIARLHATARNFPARHPNDYGLAWCKRTAERLYPDLTAAEGTLLRGELEGQTARDASLPRGTIHADLFRDNVLFDEDRLTGIIDFYYACDELLLYDLAIALSDWCVNENRRIDHALASSLLSAYAETRPVSDKEIDNWPLIVRLTCLRWWLFRLERKFSATNVDAVNLKDPDEFKGLLQMYSAGTEELIGLWSR